MTEELGEEVVAEAIMKLRIIRLRNIMSILDFSSFQTACAAHVIQIPLDKTDKSNR